VRAVRRRPQDCSVLLVDDNSINQLVIRGMLLKLGYQVRTTENARGALALLRRESVDAVLLDCQIEQAEALKLCDQVRGMPGCADLPVLLVSASAHAVEAERCLLDYLSRPVKFEELQAVLARRVLASEQGESAGI
ncbi:MAG: response regulator, partial [Pseudomonas chlororaphis]